ncbi:unnamed protein product [Pedinophyceae sp. YPF-701]|nr:unnamed protein product [Pedinophyceae sp. YPF-701]
MRLGGAEGETRGAGRRGRRQSSSGGGSAAACRLARRMLCRSAAYDHPCSLHRGTVKKRRPTHGVHHSRGSSTSSRYRTVTGAWSARVTGHSKPVGGLGARRASRSVVAWSGSEREQQETHQERAVMAERPAQVGDVEEAAPMLSPQPTAGVEGARADGKEAPALWRRMLWYTPSVMAGPMIDPLVAMTESQLLGLHASSAELAALVPNGLIFTFLLYAFQGLQMTTLAHTSRHHRRSELADADAVLSTALAVALAAGTVFTLLLLLIGPGLVTLILSSASEAVVAPAIAYLRVKALALPAIFGNMVFIAGLIGQGRVPQVVICAVLGVALHRALAVHFVGGLGLGVQGAAGATAACQWGLTVLLWTALAVLPRRSFACPVPWRGSLARVRELAGSVSLLGTGYLLKNCCYLICQTTAAALPTAQLAAHQAAYSVWNLAAFVDAPVEKLGVTFVPAETTAAGQRHVAWLLGVAGVALSVCTAAACAGMLVLLPGQLTSDVRLHSLLANVAPLVALTILANGGELAASGTLMGRGAAAHFMCIHAWTVGALLVGRLVLAVRGELSLVAVWGLFLVFFLSRCFHANRLLVAHAGWHWLGHRRGKPAAEVDERTQQASQLRSDS